MMLFMLCFAMALSKNRILVSIAELLISIILVSSCKQKFPITEEMVAAKPDSLLTVLLDINPESLKSARDRADYAIFLSMALDKNYIDIASDSIIAPAIQYYGPHRPFRKQMLTAYYHGRVLYNEGKVTDAAQAFERAESLADKLKDDFFLGLVFRNFGLLYDYTYNSRKVVECHEMSRDAFHRAGAFLYETYEKMALASALGNDGRHSESINHFEELLSDPSIDSLDKRNMYLNYARELVHADTCHRKALTLFNLGEKGYYTPIDYGAWAYCSYKVGDTQTAKTLMDYALTNANDVITKGALAFYQYKCALIEGDEKKALSFLETATETQDRIAQEKLAESIDDARSAYSRELLDAKEAKMKRGRIILLAGFLILLSAFCYSFFRRRKQQKETMARMEEIQSSLDISIKKNNSLVNALMIEQIDTLRLVADEYENSIDSITKERFFQAFKKRLDEFRQYDSDLTLLESSINKYRDNAMDLFRKEFPNGTKYFYRMGAMFFAGFPYDLMSLLTKSSIPTLKSGKSQLKKKIANSEAPHRELFLKLLDSAEKRPAGRPVQHPHQ